MNPLVLISLILALVLGIGASHAAVPQRIVTLAPNLAELVCAAGGCNRLVGVSAYTDFPPQAARAEQIGDAYSINLEAVLATRPDLVLAWNHATPPEVIARLRNLGLHVEVPQIHGLDDIARVLRRLGQQLGTQAVADRAADRYHQRLTRLRRRYAGASRLRVFYQLGTAPAYTINHASSASAALALCGGDNVFADLPRISGPVSAEAVLAARPQVVFYGQTENRSEIRAYWARLPAVPAVRHHDLFAVDGDLLARASPRVLNGIADVCRKMDRVRKQIATRNAKLEKIEKP